MSLWRREVRDLSESEVLRSFASGDAPIMHGNMDTALRLIPVYAAVSLIVDSIATMPAHIYEVRNGRKQVLTEQPSIVESPHPHPAFTRIEWVQQFGVSFLLRGNAYGEVVQIDRGGMPSKIAWLNPDAVRVDETGDRVRYYYGSEDRLIDSSAIVHIPWFPKPGSVVGLSPIGQFKSQFETGVLASSYGRNWFRNSGVPKGHLRWARGPLDAEAAATSKERFKAAVSGGDIFVSGNDWDWKQLSVAPNEAQFLETIQAGATEIAAIFRVSPTDIGGKAADSLTYDTLELNQLRLQVRALQPVFTRLEQHMNRILTPGLYYKFNPDALVRTDIKTRMEAYQIALMNGVYTRDYVRDKEDQPPMTKREHAQWLEDFAHKGGANNANPNGNPSGTQQPQPNKGGA